MKILITGSEGFIGKSLVEYLSPMHEIIGVDRLSGKEAVELSEKSLRHVDIVIHLAAQTSVWNEDDKQIVEDNIVAFKCIFDLCRKLNKKLIWASSSCAVNITSLYGLTKHFCEEYHKLNNYGNCVCLRFHNVYGKNARKDTLLGKCFNNNIVYLYNNGKNRRHFTYIEDVCKCIERSFDMPAGIYNVYNEEENTTEEFVNEVKKYKNIEVVYLPEKREKDKEHQKVETDVQNLLKTPTKIGMGIENIMKIKN